MTAARRIVVVGNGMAGSRIVAELLERDVDRRLEITVVGDEPGDAYNRMQLSNVLAGTASVENLTLASAHWYAEQGVTLHSGNAAVGLDRAERRIALADGAGLAYDLLVLATGSSAVIPALDGLAANSSPPDTRAQFRLGARLTAGAVPLKAGAVPFRTLTDCLTIDSLAEDARSAVVVGAGVLGLEAARGLAGRGLDVTLLQRGSRLMERQLDIGASRALARTAREFGVEVRTATIRTVLGEDRVEGVLLEDGDVLAVELIVLSCGVRPRVELARAAGLAIDAGIIVDDQLRSSDPAVFAVGECAEHRGEVHGLVAPAWEQARIAAEVIIRPELKSTYRGSPKVVRLKAAGIELVSLGDPSVEYTDLDEQTELVHYNDSGRGVYQKLVVRAGRLTGAILLGDTRTAGTLTQLFDRGAALPADRSGLLMTHRGTAAPSLASPTVLPDQATICSCNGVTKAGICAAWADGACDVPGVAARTRATTGCGTCRDAVEGILDWLAAADGGTRTPDSDATAELDGFDIDVKDIEIDVKDIEIDVKDIEIDVEVAS